MKNHARNALIALLALMFILSMTRFAKAVGPSINLPAGTVKATFNNPGLNSYWSITLSSVPSGYDVTNLRIYVGWCCDQTLTIGNGATLDVTLYSSYDPNPYTHNVNPGDWNKVNYIINHPASGSVWQDVQDAIWYYIDGQVQPPSGSKARTMTDDADTNGASYVPVPGEKLAVVVWAAGYQTTFIEVIVRAQLTLATNPAGVNSPTGSGFYDFDFLAPISTPQDVDIVSGSSRYDFRGWQTSDMPEITASSAASTTVRMDKDKTVTANYVIQYYLTVNSAYDSPTGAGWYDSGQIAPFSISPTAINAGGGVTYVFTGWSSSDPHGYNGPLASTSVTFGNNPITETAQWVVKGSSVGGEWAPITLQVMSPINAVQLVATWIALALIAAASAFAAYRRWFKKHW